MFVRFRQSGRRLQASLVETQRFGSKVTHHHVASLGSIEMLPPPAKRMEFWVKLHRRLDALANRVDSETRHKIMDAIHARIPMPTMDDLHAVQAENTKSDIQFWETLHDMQASELEGHKALMSATQRIINEREPATAAAAAKAQAARDRLGRIEQGENVAGIGTSSDLKTMLTAMGWKPSDIRHASRLARIGEIDGAWAELLTDINERRGKVEKAASRAVLRRRRIMG